MKTPKQDEMPLSDPRIFVPPMEGHTAGDHYKEFPIQPVEFCELNCLPYCMSSIIKSVMRHKLLGEKDDLIKASNYASLGASMHKRVQGMWDRMKNLAGMDHAQHDWMIIPGIFVEANKLTGREVNIIRHLASVFDAAGMMGYLRAKEEIDLLLKEDHR